MHDSFDTISTHTLHCVGQALPHAVSLCRVHLSVRGLVLKKYASQLFGEDEDSGSELDEAEKQGENGAYCLYMAPLHNTDAIRSL